MSSNNSNSANLSLAERIRLSREQEERERRRRAQEALHRLQEQSSSHASAAPADASASASAAMSTVGREFVTTTTLPVAAATPVAVGGGGTSVVMHHNLDFIGNCLEETCIADEDERKFKGRSHVDNAIYEIFYTNPVKCCGVVMEIGAGDGLDGSVSHFFEQGLNWKSILVEANPQKFKKLKENRPDAIAINAGFCESGSMTFDGEFHPEDPDEIISEAVSKWPYRPDASEDVMCLSMSPLIRQNLKVTHIDVMSIHISGDPLAVIRKMDWTVRVDIWIIVMDKKTPEMEERNKVVKSVLDRNEYIEADWDIKRWCDESAKGRCENNTVFLRKNFNPLYLQRSLKGRKQLRGNSK